MTKDTHFEIAEKRFQSLLEKINPDISLGTAKLTFNSLNTIMQQKQAIELPENSKIDEIKKKSISKKEIQEILDYGDRLTIPDFNIIESVAKNMELDLGKLAIAYANILTDIKNKNVIFLELINNSIEISKEYSYDSNLTFYENVNDFIKFIKNNSSRNFNVIVDNFYVEVIAISLLLKEK